MMRPLAEWPAADRRGLVGVFTDIDDTLTTDGDITPDALQALHDLRAAGLRCVAITGRPVGWSAQRACAWPLDAVVAENGAVALVAQTGGSWTRLYRQDAATRAAQFARMQQVLEAIEREIPGARRSQDSPGRECDIAIDHGEFAQLDDATIAAVVARMRAAGLHATVSSIHVNGWLGDHDKLEGARWIARELWRRDLDNEIGRWAYVGDSANDAPMFERFVHSIGVANVRRFEATLTHLPRYVSASTRGAGFAEAMARVLEVRDRS